MARVFFVIFYDSYVWNAMKHSEHPHLSALLFTDAFFVGVARGVLERWMKFFAAAAFFACPEIMCPFRAGTAARTAAATWRPLLFLLIVCRQE